MDKRFKEFIEQNPFLSILFFVGAVIGLLVPQKLNLAARVYSSGLSSQSFSDPTGLFVNFLIVIPITILVELICAMLGGVVLAIFGFFIDRRYKKNKKDREDIAGLYTSDSKKDIE